MAQVVLNVNGHAYTMQCDDGEEDHLRDLGMALDAEVNKIKSAVGQVGEIRLLLMSGLVIADRLSEALKKIEELEDRIEGMRQTRASAAKETEFVSKEVSARISAAAERVESLAREIAK